MAVLSDLIRHDTPLATDAAAIYQYKASIERKYRFISRFGDEVLLHRVAGKHILIPRALCPVGEEDNRSLGVSMSFPKCPDPRPGQERVFEETVEFLQKGMSGLVCAQTGFGKTVVGFYATHFLGKKTLVITTKDDIYKQWLLGAREFLGLLPHEIGEIRQDKCQVIGTKFVVAMIHSLSTEGKYPDWIVNDFGLVIFDECHRLPAEKFGQVAWMFPAKLRLGLTATPKRVDGKDPLVMAHIGPIRVQGDVELMVPKVLRIVTNWQCPRVLRTDPYTGERKVTRIHHEQGKTTHVEKMMAADPERNLAIATVIKRSFEAGRRTVVFSTLHAHLQALHNQAAKIGVSPRQMGYYVGVTTKKEREAREAILSRPVIFTTYGMMGEGTDVPWLDTCIFAIPRSNVQQPGGRIRREYEDKKSPVIIDFVDLDSPVFAGYATNRMEWYKSLQCEIVEVDP